jgi:hypothetical protein
VSPDAVDDFDAVVEFMHIAEARRSHADLR